MVTSYWTKRRQQERKWQEQQLKDDDKFAKKVQDLYETAIQNISDEIDRQLNWLADKNESTYAEMQKAVSSYDLQRGEKLAQQLISRANTLRKEGKPVRYVNFTEQENAHMRLYNATMRINRLEYLKSMAGLECLDMTDQLNSELGVKLDDATRKEFKRQAGIMGEQLTNVKPWTSYDTQEIVMKSIGGGNWSDRLWRNQDALKARLDEVISTGIISGDNPREMARKLKANVKTTITNQRYVTERLARTETARVQYQAQRISIHDNGFEWAEWFAEPKACAVCTAIANKDNGEGSGIYKLKFIPTIPDNTHPNCRCSIGSYYSDEMLDKKLEELGFGQNEGGMTTRQFGKSLRDELAVQNVRNMRGIASKNLTAIYDSIKKLYQRYPNMKGFIKEVVGSDSSRGGTIAAAGWSTKLVGNMVDFNVRLIINKANFNTIQEQLAGMVKKGWFTKKNGLEDVIDHEMGHMVDYYQTARMIDIDPLADKLHPVDTLKFQHLSENSPFSQDVLFRAFNEAGIELNVSNMKKYISKYGAQSVEEAFAELYSDRGNSKLKKSFDKVLKERAMK